MLAEGQRTHRLYRDPPESMLIKVPAEDATRDEIMGALWFSDLPYLRSFDGVLVEDQFFDVERVWAQAALLGGVRKVSKCFNSFWLPLLERKKDYSLYSMCQ